MNRSASEDIDDIIFFNNTNTHKRRNSKQIDKDRDIIVIEEEPVKELKESIEINKETKQESKVVELYVNKEKVDITTNNWINLPRARKVGTSETVFSVIRNIDSDFVVKQSRWESPKLKKLIVSNTIIGRHVPYGHISIGSCCGNPKVYPEGYYYFAGIGSKFGKLHKLNTPILTSNKNLLTIVTLKENEMAIAVNPTTTKVCHGPGQYVLLEPWSIVGEVVKI